MTEFQYLDAMYAEGCINLAHHLKREFNLTWEAAFATYFKWAADRGHFNEL